MLTGGVQLLGEVMVVDVVGREHPFDGPFKQLGVVKELTDIVATAADDPSLGERTWVLLTESPEGGWGIGGHANTNADIAAAARAELAGR